MNFLGIGTLEFLLILIFAFLFFGPEKLPEIAAKAGRLYRNLKKSTSDLGRSITEEISEEKTMYDDLSKIGKTIKQDLLSDSNGETKSGDATTPSYLPYPTSDAELTSDTAESLPMPESDDQSND